MKVSVNLNTKKIIEKADAYVIAVGTLTGIRQKLEKEISGE